jgi:hypothetical protein
MPAKVQQKMHIRKFSGEKVLKVSRFQSALPSLGDRVEFQVTRSEMPYGRV